MRIALINPVRAHISGGYREYLSQLLRRIAEDPDIEAVLFVSIPTICAEFSHFKKIETFDISVWYHLLPGSPSLMNKLRSFAPDILYSPVEKKLPSLGYVPRLIMIQNMEPFVDYPAANHWLQNLRLRFLKKMAIKAIKSSDHIIALTHFVYDYLVEKQSVNPAAVTRIPHGATVDSEIAPTRPTILPDQVSFIFTAGSISPARGLEDIVKAFVEVKKQAHLQSLKLVIAGEVQRYSKTYYRELQVLVNQSGLSDDVVWLGFIDKSQMKWCYENCTLFVMSSRVESFGIIALEAMTYGANVVSSTSPCLPEVFGDYASYYEPGDWQSLAKFMADMANNHQHPRSTGENVINAEYDWQHCYMATKALFNKLTVNQ